MAFYYWPNPSTLTYPASGGSSFTGLPIQDEGVSVASATILNFIGAGVTATDAGGGTVDVTIPGGSGFTQNIETRTITAPEDAAMALTLVGTPLTPAEVVLEVGSAPTQIYADDYSVTGTTLSWAALGLDGILAAGDRVRIIYET